MLLFRSPKLIFSATTIRYIAWLTLCIFALCRQVYSNPIDFNSKQAEILLYDRCEGCHNDYIFDGNWSVEDIHVSDVEKGKNQARWESILKSVAMGDMPPAKKKPLSEEQKNGLLSWLQHGLDDYSEHHPNPGRATLRRLNRHEYARSVRDLLALDIDVSQALPGDDSGYGFDNNADVLSMSTTLLERYLSVAGKVSRLATGEAGDSVTKARFVVPKDGSVKNSGLPAFDLRMHDDLPIDSRGGGSFQFYAPVTGQYEIAGFINANTNNEIDRLDIHRYQRHFTLSAGNHTVGMAFRKQLALSGHTPEVREGTDYVVLPERPPTELDLDFIIDGARVYSVKVPSYHMSARFSQATFLRDVLEIEVTGPLTQEQKQSSDNFFSISDTPSARKIFTCVPASASLLILNDSQAASEQSCAREIISALAEEAYRRPLKEEDVTPLLGVFQRARASLAFRGAISQSIQALLVSPGFMYLRESIPDNVSDGDIYRITDTEFAARLALFLWSSLPDETLRKLAETGKLRQPEILRQQIQRMLKSDKARALTDNFAGQWLFLRNLPYHFPDVFAFPEFNVPLKHSIKKETELFFTRILKDNRPVFDFLNANYTYLNEPLAKHYGIEGVKGYAFRKVIVDDAVPRGGLLGQASILTLTSNPNHTSPVKRGKWILDNLLAASPPPPPPDVPALVAEHDGIALTAREQLARHRADPVCAACHVRMDPLGLALEQYNAVGAFRTRYADQPIDVTAKMPDGTAFEGLRGLHTVLWDRRERFAHAFVDRLLTYALGRGLEAYDQPVVRAITREARAEQYRMHSIIEAIVKSTPFNYKLAPEIKDEKPHIVQAH